MSKRRHSPALLGIEQRTDRKGTKRYRGTARDRHGRPLRGPWTTRLAEARGWRVDALARVRAGTLSAGNGPVVRDAVDHFIRGMKNGWIRNRSGDPYKPSAIRGYERDLRNRVEPAFGAARLDELSLPILQRWADDLAAEGLAASTVRNIANALRALYGWALPRGLARVNPTHGLRLPTGGAKRERIASPVELARLIGALRPLDQVALGLAGYAGLRLGELLALQWSSVDLERRRLDVVRAWDHGAHLFVPTKSRRRRTVPIPDPLALLLADHRVLTNHANGLLLAGRDPSRPVSHNALRDRMREAWARAALEPLGFHEARHTCASIMIASGVNAKAVSTFLGHAGIEVTFNVYGHLMPESEDEARELIDAYLEPRKD